jgi:hypothetical protein
VVRQGFAFRWHADTLVTPQARRDAAADGDAQRVLEYLRKLTTEGYYTATELEGEAATVGIGGKRIRAAVHRLRARELVVERDLPEDLRKGGRKTYLDPVAQEAPELDTSKPIFEAAT